MLLQLLLHSQLAQWAHLAGEGVSTHVCRFGQGGKSRTPNGKEVETATIETRIPRGY